MGKRNVKLFVISDENSRTEMMDNYGQDPETILECDLAMNSIRAKCFSGKNLSGVTADENGEDWELNNALLSAMINGCDAVAVVGMDITPDMEKQIQYAKRAGKIVCVEETLREKVKAMDLDYSKEPLIAVCRKILSIA